MVIVRKILLGRERRTQQEDGVEWRFILAVDFASLNIFAAAGPVLPWVISVKFSCFNLSFVRPLPFLSDSFPA